MKIKLDENLREEIVDLLAARGHDVHTVRGESLAGHDNTDIFDIACREQRVLFTQDLDFSDLRKFRPGTDPGIVIIRLREPSRRTILARLRQIFEEGPIDGWAGCFIVVGDGKLRVRR
ncbi:MAG TPA: DUF5615 family PIN-like protein [Tepidisphaeraceae bacterium]|jgi:predicted nuclease of predicted toxin-antitoxin system|nr:DUF5615 family PIN-like protein [Tepidisphaeraceae bacterium]